MTAALTIDGLQADFSGFKAVDGVSLIVDDGELRVLLGANGAGKTTLMDLISGKTKSSAGRVFVGDTEITNWPAHRIARAGIGRKFQIPSIFKDLSVRENLEVAACPSFGVFSNIRFGFPAASRRKVDATLALAGLSEFESRPAGELSHGQTQWLELAMLIIQERRIILLDEPTAGMTQAETRKTSEIINRMRGRHTLVVVEHDMTFVREIAEKITVMHLGKVLAEGDIRAIETNEAVRQAYLGSRGIA